MSTFELLTAWRDASRAADLADRLSEAAAEAVDRADLGAAVAEEVAALAERTATAANAAAERARRAADEARQVAIDERAGKQFGADAVSSDAHAAEGQAREAFHHAEDAARTKQTGRG